MGIIGGKRKIKSNSALVIAAGCAVAFMFIATIISIVIYKQRMEKAGELMAEAKYQQYDSYVVMISSDDDSDFWKQVYESAKEVGAENGIYVDMLSASVDKTYSKLELIEMAIATDCDAIFVEGDDTPETAAALQKANRAGIAVFTLSSDVEIDNRTSYIGSNPYSIANLYANSLVENLTTQKKVMVLGGNTISINTANAFVNNIQTAMTTMELPNGPLEFDVRTVESTDAFATEEYVQNLFKENDLAPIVICLDGESTASFYQAMIDYNKVGQIMLLGTNKSQTVLTGIKQHVITSTVFVDPAAIGKAAAEAYIELRGAGYVSEYISVEANIIDSDNVADELQEVENE
jgi:ribose transport system substrate-binding protein